MTDQCRDGWRCAEITLRNVRGLHARASAKLVAETQKFDADVLVGWESLEVSADSIMDLLMLAAPCGATLHIRAKGGDADTAMAALVDLIDRRAFDEETADPGASA